MKANIPLSGVAVLGDAPVVTLGYGASVPYLETVHSREENGQQRVEELQMEQPWMEDTRVIRYGWVE